MSDFFLPNVPKDEPEIELMVKFGAEWSNHIQLSAKKAKAFVEKTFADHELTFEEQLAVWKELTDLRIDSKQPFNFLMDLLAWTGNIPTYPSNVTLTPYAEAVSPRIGSILQKWAGGLLVADILKSYHLTLRKYGPLVPEATSGRIPANLGVRYLHTAFPRILVARMAWFRDSYILLRASRALPL